MDNTDIYIEDKLRGIKHQLIHVPGRGFVRRRMGEALHNQRELTFEELVLDTHLLTLEIMDDHTRPWLLKHEKEKCALKINIFGVDEDGKDRINAVKFKQILAVKNKYDNKILVSRMEAIDERKTETDTVERIIPERMLKDLMLLKLDSNGICEKAAKWWPTVKLSEGDSTDSIVNRAERRLRIARSGPYSNFVTKEYKSTDYEKKDDDEKQNVPVRVNNSALKKKSGVIKKKLINNQYCPNTLMCPLEGCKANCMNATSFVRHLRSAHKSTPGKEKVVFRCECEFTAKNYTYLRKHVVQCRPTNIHVYQSK